MKIEFDSKFYKSINKLNLNKEFKSKLKDIIIEIENKDQINDVNNLIKLKGFKYYYRIRLNDYRIGLKKINESTIKLILIAHRKDIYNIFP